MSERLRELADRRLPGIEALIERAQRVRSWLETAQSCGCQSIDECALFDDAAAPPARPRAYAPSKCRISTMSA